MSKATHGEGETSRPARRPIRKGKFEPAIVRKPVVKKYGAKSKYLAPGESAYEKRRANRD